MFESAKASRNINHRAYLTVKYIFMDDYEIPVYVYEGVVQQSVLSYLVDPKNKVTYRMVFGFVTGKLENKTMSLFNTHVLDELSSCYLKLCSLARNRL